MSAAVSMKAKCGCSFAWSHAITLQDPEPELVWINLCEQHRCTGHTGDTQKNESVADSFLDAANYAIFGWMTEQGYNLADDKNFWDGYDQAVLTLRKVTTDRRAKYGAGNLIIHGALGLVVRLSDKISRLNQHFFKRSK